MKMSFGRVGSVAALLGTIACGGSSPTQPPTPSPSPTAAATPTATAPVPGVQPTDAPPVPSPIPEDQNPGPVATVRTRLYVVRNRPGGDVRPGPYYDEISNNDVVRVGEFLVIDTTPFNKDGQKCQAQAPPQWGIDNAGIFELLGSSNPFQVRANARRKGVSPVVTTVDGIRSNVINIEVR